MAEIFKTSDIKSSAIKSVKWTALGEVFFRSIQPAVILVLARILTPADFGIVGVAMIAIGLAQILQDFGLAKTLIQQEKDIPQSANIIFWTNVGLSICLYGTIYIATPWLALFFREPYLEKVLKILCLQIMLTSLFSVHQALLQRDFQFKKLFWVRLSASITPGLVAVPLACLDFGVWALVYGTLVGGVAQACLFWIFSDWRPSLSFDFTLAGKLFSFSSWVALEAFLGWLLVWGDSIVLGHFLGVKELGIYRVGLTFLMLLFGAISQPLISVAYSAFSRLQAEPEELKQAFLNLNKNIAFFMLPVGLGLAVLAKPIAAVVFGGKWEGIEVVIALIGINHALIGLVSINPEVYRAMGKPDVQPKILLLAACYYLPVYIIFAPRGLYVFCVARLTLAIISMGPHIYAISRLLKLPYSYLINCLKPSFIIAGTAMAAAIVIINNILPFYGNVSPNILSLSIFIVLGGGIYFLMVWLLDKSFILQTINLLKRVA